jgi:ribosome-binding protein aMBF1 (putative translation factor)
LAEKATRLNLRKKRGASDFEAPLFVDNRQHSQRLYLKFGERIREKRLSLELSQADLSRMALIDRSYLAEIESGKRHLSLSIAYRLAKCLGSSLDTLLKDIDGTG